MGIFRRGRVKFVSPTKKEMEKMRAKKHILHPLTEEQKAFVEINHNLVYQFLRRKNYSVEEYYNVVILDYIMACQMYLERENLQEKYDFPIIAYMRMNSAISNHFKAKNCHCRKSAHGTVSIEQLSDPDIGTGKEIASDNLDVLERIIRSEQDEQFMENLLLILPERQGKIVLYLMDGYKEREIYKFLEIGRKIYRSEMEKIKDALENLLNK